MHNIIKRIYRFSHQITPQLYSSLFKEFQTSPSISTFAQYYHRDNLVEIFNIVKNTNLPLPKKIQTYNAIQTLCDSSTEMDFNILANLKREKSALYYRQQNMYKAITQIEGAIQAILSMDEPFPLEVAQLYWESSNLFMLMQEYLKAQKQLRQAENILLIFEEEVMRNSEENKEGIKEIHRMLAQTYSNLCFLEMKKKGSLSTANWYMEQSMSRWQKSQKKQSSWGYEGTIKYKCILLMQKKQKNLAFQTAKDHLQRIPETDMNRVSRLWFLKLLSEEDEKYKLELKEKVEALSKVMPPDALTATLKQIGLIEK